MTHLSKTMQIFTDILHDDLIEDRSEYGIDDLKTMYDLTDEEAEELADFIRLGMEGQS